MSENGTTNGHGDQRASTGIARDQAIQPYRWQPGVSGNPNGTPNGIREVRRLARDHAEAALLRLVELTTHNDGKVAVRACEAILNRAYGLPKQTLELDGAPEVATMIAELFKQRVLALAPRKSA